MTIETRGARLQTSARELLAQVDAAVEQIEATLAKIRDVQPVDATSANRALAAASEAVRSLHHLMNGSAEPTEPWKDRASFEDALGRVVRSIDSAEARIREMLAGLSDILDKGEILHRVAALRKVYEDLRSAAVTEVANASRALNPPPLPGPQLPQQWLRWAWEHRHERDLHQVQASYPSLADFVQGIEPDHFKFAEEVAHQGADLPATLAQPGAPKSSTPLVAPAPLSNPANPPSGQGSHAQESTASPAIAIAKEPPAPARVPDAVPLLPASAQTVDLPSQAVVPNMAGSPSNIVALNKAVSPGPAAVPPTTSGVASPGPILNSALAQQTVTATTEAKRPPAKVEFPEELVTFDAFAKSYWIEPSGKCAPVPWQNTTPFRSALGKAQEQALGDRDFAKLHVLAKAGEELALTELLSPREVESVAQLIASPDNPTAGVSSSRSQALARAAFGGWEGSASGLRLAVFLEAVRPSPDLFGIANALNELMGAAGFHNRELSEIVLWLLRSAVQGLDGMERLRAATDKAPPASPERLKQQLDSARKAFHKTVTNHWSAAGGKIEHTHCRLAWAEFVNHYKALFQRLYPPSHGGAADWEGKQLRAEIGGMFDRFTDFADKATALHGDRQKMNRAARAIIDAAASVNVAMEAWRASQQPTSKKVDVPSLGLLEHVSECAAEPDESLCKELLRMLLRPAPAASSKEALGLRPRHLVQYPELIAFLDGLQQDELRRDSQHDDPLSASIRSHPHAAAIMCLAPSGPRDGVSGSILSILTSDFERRQRGDLTYRLSPFIAGQADAHLQRERAQATDRLMVEVGAIKAAWQVLDALAAPEAVTLEEISEHAREVVTDEPRSSRESLLIEAWLKRVNELAFKMQKLALQTVLETSASEPHKQRITEALSSGDYLGAIMAARESHRPDVAPVRETEWRGYAARLYLNIASEFEQIRSEIPQAKDLLESWRGKLQLRGRMGDRGLRSAFVDSVLVDKELKPHITKEHTEIKIPTGEIRRWMGSQRLNPSFVPQLARFNQLVITTPTALLEDRAVVASTTAEVAKYDSSMVIVLTPGLTAARRGEFRAEFAKRRTYGAVLDDLDLIRLLNPGRRRPNGLIGLLEIFLEQQTWAWSLLSPFGSHEGQHVQMEMYVGRHDDAELLSTTANFSRLFSGRKLGKSALLRYIEESRGSHRLPSGSSLKVVYVLIQGAESEADVTDRIIRALQERLGFTAPPVTPHEDAAKALETALNAFLGKRPNESLLIILDEADVFVEAQLEDFDRRHERCLSWQMRSLESSKDAHGFPRIRFLFSGYRATQTADGAWANWGDVRRLAPLSPDEATRLIEGPLARMGINVRAHAAAIAWRCGYQPAVLLRFGQQLLEVLDRVRVGEERISVEVTPDDIASTFNETAVQDEIRTVVRNNFVGNPAALAVFSALLIELGELSTGEGLEDASQRILNRLLKLDRELTWLLAHGSSPQGEIDRMLRDFVQRELVKRHDRKGGRYAYSLRFPHHLPVLRPADPEAALKDSVTAMGRAGESRALVRSVFDRSEIESLRYALGPTGRDLGITAAVAASAWRTVLTHESGGILDLIGGIPASAVIGPGQPLKSDSQDHLVLLDPNPGEAQKLIVAREKSKRRLPLLLGGVQVARWTLEQSGRGAAYEIAALGRVSRPGLSWWFERVRCLEFSDPSAIDRILERTSGIPALLQVFEEELLKKSGETKQKEDVIQALEAAERRIPEIARELCSPASPQGLTPREREVLKMVVVVGRATKFADVPTRDDLVDCWDEFHRSTLNVKPLGDDDFVPLSIVQRLGYLPVRPGGTISFPLDRLRNILKDDALIRLVNALENA